MLKVLKAELMRQQWALLISTVLLGPALCIVLGVNPGTPSPGVSQWTLAYGCAVVRFAWLFYPLLAGVLAALVCRPDHAAGGWKLVLSLPVRRWQVYVAKAIVLAALLGLANVALGAEFLLAGLLSGLRGAVPWQTLGWSLLSGWVAVLPLAALQLWVSSRWRSFGAALALNVVLTLPAIFAAQSRDIAPWYPWAQPLLAMSPLAQRAAGRTMLNVAPSTLWIVIVGGLLVAGVGGLLTFARADVRQ